MLVSSRRVAAVLFVLSTPVLAQWLNYPTAGIPKSAKGQPNLTAPTPKTADGKPDLSGMWEPLKNRPCPPEGCADFQTPQEFANIGWGLKGGLPYQKWAADLRKTRMADLGERRSRLTLPADGHREAAHHPSAQEDHRNAGPAGDPE
jgi:hypothetical protein